MLSFCGKDYLGMQRNPGFPTIEEELLKALLAAGTISQEWFDCPQQAHFQRASRTDKGVSAMRMVISTKLLYNETNVDETIAAINSHLPATVMVNEIRRVTKNFNCKNACDSRTYKYLMPTYALSNVTPLPLPLQEEHGLDEAALAQHRQQELEAFQAHEKYRVTPDVIDKTNALLAKYIGPHYYHNFTSGKLPFEPSSQRFMTKFEVVKTFVEETENGNGGLEMALLEVKGQSFMLHQIRKMIGMVLAIVRGHCPDSTLELAWGAQRVDIPRAPGLGLMLDQVHYETYNHRFGGKESMHEKLEWSRTDAQVEEFMRKNVYSDIVRTEVGERSMLKWLQTLNIHNYEARHFENTGGNLNGEGLAAIVATKRAQKNKAGEEVGEVGDSAATQPKVAKTDEDAANKVAADGDKVGELGDSSTQSKVAKAEVKAENDAAENNKAHENKVGELGDKGDSAA